MPTPRRWQEPFLGLDEIPQGLTNLEIGYFFGFSPSERDAILSRRGDHNRLAFALQLGFIRMTGRTLDALDRIPIRVLIHVNHSLAIE